MKNMDIRSFRRPIGLFPIIIQHSLFVYFIFACVHGIPFITPLVRCVVTMDSVVYKRIRNVKLVRSQDRATQNEAVIGPLLPIGVKRLGEGKSFKERFPNAYSASRAADPRRCI